MAGLPQKGHTQFVTEAIEQMKKNYQEASDGFKYNPFNTFAKVAAKQYKEAIDLMERAVKFRVPKDGDILSDIVDGRTIKDVVNSYLTTYKLPFPLLTIECENEVLADHENFIPNHLEYKGTVVIVWQTERENLNPIFHMQILNKCRDSVNSANRQFEWYILPYTLDIDLEYVKLNERWEKFVTPRTIHPSVPLQDVFNDCKNEVAMFTQFIIALSCKNVNIKKGFPPSLTENKKREKKGKAKLNQYHDIVIETKFGQVKPITGKKTIEGATSGSKAPHLRRGHIRHYEGKNVWIEATFVNAHKGTAQPKSYRIK